MGLGQGETESERRKRIQRDVIASIHSFSATDRKSREETHRRRAIR